MNWEQKIWRIYRIKCWHIFRIYRSHDKRWYVWTEEETEIFLSIIRDLRDLFERFLKYHSGVRSETAEKCSFASGPLSRNKGKVSVKASAKAVKVRCQRVRLLQWKSTCQNSQHPPPCDLTREEKTLCFISIYQQTQLLKHCREQYHCLHTGCEFF